MAKKISVLLSGKPFSWIKTTPVLLALGAFLLFANTIGNGYNMDDELVTFGHRYTSKGLSSLSDILTNPYYSDAMGYKYGYRPLVHVSFAIEHQFLGENPHVSHFINVLLYALCVYLFFRLLKIWMGKDGQIMAIVATALFAIHPVHTEVVASIKNRDEILALLFGLAGGISFFGNGEKKYGGLVMASIWFLLALLTKKSMYPLALIYPVASVVMGKRTLKKTLFASMFLIVPGIIIVSELGVLRMMMLFVAPVLLVVFVYYLKKMVVGEYGREHIGRVVDHGVPVFFVLGAVLLLVGQGNILWYLASFGLSIVTISIRPLAGILLLVGCMTVIGYFVDPVWAFGAVVVAAWGLFFFRAETGRFSWLFIVAGMVTLIMYLVGGYGGIGDPILVYILFFLLGRYRKITIPLAALLVVALAYNYMKNDALYEWMALVLVLIMHSVESKIKSWPKHFFVYAMSFMALCFYLFSNFSDIRAAYFSKSEPVVEIKMQLEKTSSNLQEGRQLEFAENTLTTPHMLGETIGTGAITLGEYLRLMVFPWELSFYYGYAKIDTVSLANPWVWLSLLAHLGLLVLAFWQIKKRPFVTIGILWYVLSIGLFSNWVELVAGMVGERLAFTASAGFCILVAALIVWIKPSLDFKKPGWVEVGLLLICVVFSFRTVVRNADWKDRLTLMGRDIQHLDNSAQANNLYALNLMGAVFGREGNYTDEQKRNMMLLAQKHFDRAIQIWPDFFNAAYDKGRVALTLGDKQTAMAAFEHAVSIKRKEVFSDPYYQLDKLYFEFRMYDKLLKNAKAITRIEDNPEVYNRLAKGYYYVGKPDSSIYYLDMGLQRYPNDNSILQNKSEIMRHLPLVQ